MKMVIDIDEDTYKYMQSRCQYQNKGDKGLSKFEKVGVAIKNGIPLPKGHGKIIDYGYVVDAIDDWVNAEEYRYTNATDYLRKRVANTPTIIEADKEVQE